MCRRHMLAFLCFQRDCFALDPWENSPEVRAQAQAEGWESCAIALVLGSAHVGRRCCGDVEVVVVRAQKTKKKKKKTVRKGLLHRAERTFAVYTEGQSKRNQPTISRTIVGFAALSVYFCPSFSSSSVSSVLFASHSINKQPGPSQPPFLSCH